MKSCILIILLAILTALSLSAACGNIIYVKHDVYGLNIDGSSWDTAYPDLQSALDKARTCQDIQEIWVAQGSYSPTVNTAGSTSNSVPQNRTFVVDFNIRLYGGFRGDESTLTES